MSDHRKFYKVNELLAKNSEEKIKGHRCLQKENRSKTFDCFRKIPYKVDKENTKKPFIVGKVRHKIHSPPFLHESIANKNVKENKSQNLLQTLAPKNYKFCAPRGLKPIPITFSPASSFTLKGLFMSQNYNKTKEDKLRFENVTIRPRPRKLAFQTPLSDKTNMKYNQEINRDHCEKVKKNIWLEELDDIFIFGRSNVLKASELKDSFQTKCKEEIADLPQLDRFSGGKNIQLNKPITHVIETENCSLSSIEKPYMDITSNKSCINRIMENLSNDLQLESPHDKLMYQKEILDSSLNEQVSSEEEIESHMPVNLQLIEHISPLENKVDSSMLSNVEKYIEENDLIKSDINKNDSKKSRDLVCESSHIGQIVRNHNLNKLPVPKRSLVSESNKNNELLVSDQFSNMPPITSNDSSNFLKNIDELHRIVNLNHFNTNTTMDDLYNNLESESPIQAKATCKKEIINLSHPERIPQEKKTQFNKSIQYNVTPTIEVSNTSFGNSGSSSKAISPSISSYEESENSNSDCESQSAAPKHEGNINSSQAEGSQQKQDYKCKKLINYIIKTENCCLNSTEKPYGDTIVRKSKVNRTEDNTFDDLRSESPFDKHMYQKEIMDSSQTEEVSPEEENQPNKLIEQENKFDSSMLSNVEKHIQEKVLMKPDILKNDCNKSRDSACVFPDMSQSYVKRLSESLQSKRNLLLLADQFNNKSPITSHDNSNFLNSMEKLCRNMNLNNWNTNITKDNICDNFKLESPKEAKTKYKKKIGYLTQSQTISSEKNTQLDKLTLVDNISPTNQVSNISLSNFGSSTESIHLNISTFEESENSKCDHSLHSTDSPSKFISSSQSNKSITAHKSFSDSTCKSPGAIFLRFQQDNESKVIPENPSKYAKPITHVNETENCSLNSIEKPYMDITSNKSCVNITMENLSNDLQSESSLDKLRYQKEIVDSSLIKKVSSEEEIESYMPVNVQLIEHISLPENKVDNNMMSNLEKYVEGKDSIKSDISKNDRKKSRDLVCESSHIGQIVRNHNLNELPVPKRSLVSESNKNNELLVSDQFSNMPQISSNDNSNFLHNITESHRNVKPESISSEKNAQLDKIYMTRTSIKLKPIQDNSPTNEVLNTSLNKFGSHLEFSSPNISTLEKSENISFDCESQSAPTKREKNNIKSFQPKQIKKGDNKCKKHLVIQRSGNFSPITTEFANLLNSSASPSEDINSRQANEKEIYNKNFNNSACDNDDLVTPENRSKLVEPLHQEPIKIILSSTSERNNNSLLDTNISSENANYGKTNMKMTGDSISNSFKTTLPPIDSTFLNKSFVLSDSENNSLEKKITCQKDGNEGSNSTPVTNMQTLDKRIRPKIQIKITCPLNLEKKLNMNTELCEKSPEVINLLESPESSEKLFISSKCMTDEVTEINKNKLDTSPILSRTCRTNNKTGTKIENFHNEVLNIESKHVGIVDKAAKEINIINIVDSPPELKDPRVAQFSFEDYKAKFWKNEVIDLASEDEEDSSAFLSRVMKTYAQSKFNSPETLGRIITPVKNIPSVHVSPCETPRSRVKIKENSPPNCTMASPMRVLSLRNKTVLVTPSPKKGTPKLARITPCKTPLSDPNAKESSPNNTATASPIRVLSLRNRPVNISPSPKKATPKLTRVSPPKTPLSQQNVKESSPDNTATASPIRVLSLRNRPVNISPSPIKATPRVRRKPKNQRI